MYITQYLLYKENKNNVNIQINIYLLIFYIYDNLLIRIGQSR